MELTSVKKELKKRLDAIDEFMETKLKSEITLDYNQRHNSRIIDDEWIKWLNQQGKLADLMSDIEWFRSKLQEAISVLGNNLEIEINQKNMLRKTIDILDNRAKPLKDLVMPYQNNIYYCQSKSKEVR